MANIRILNKTNNSSGFTIVELIVVVVVIGILAAITIVSYNGITKKAEDVGVQADLSSSATKLKMYYTEHGTYPESIDNNGCPINVVDQNYCLTSTSGTKYSYSSASPFQSFILNGQKNSISYNITDNSSPVASTDNTTFIKSYGDNTGRESGSFIMNASDGGYITVADATNSCKCYTDTTVTKYDFKDEAVWSKSLHYAYSQYYYSGIQLSDGNLIIVGNEDNEANNTNDRALITKLDINGNILWTNTFGTENNVEITDIVQTSANYMLAVGYSYLTSKDDYDSILAKIDTDGNLVYYLAAGYNNTTQDNDWFDHITKTSDGSIFIAGTTILSGTSIHRATITKLDSNENFAWSKYYSSTDNTEFFDIIPSNDNNLIVSAKIYNSDDDIMIAKINTNGDVLWSKQIIQSDYNEVFGTIAKTNDNNYVIAGETNLQNPDSSDAIIIKFDDNGKILNDLIINSDSLHDYEYIDNVIVKNNNKILAYGSYSNDADDLSQGLLVKTNSDIKLNGCDSTLCVTPNLSSSDTSLSVSTYSPTILSPTITITSRANSIITLTAPTNIILAP